MNRTKELESDLKAAKEIINGMKLQLDALEKEKNQLEVELGEARQALRLVGAMVNTSSNGTGAPNSTIFGKFWGGKGSLGLGIGGRKSLGDPGKQGVEGMWLYIRGWLEKCTWMPCKVVRVGLRIVQAIVDVYYIVLEAWSTGAGWSSLLESKSRWVAMFVWACIIHVTI